MNYDTCVLLVGGALVSVMLLLFLLGIVSHKENDADVFHRALELVQDGRREEAFVLLDRLRNGEAPESILAEEES